MITIRDIIDGLSYYISNTIHMVISFITSIIILQETTSRY